MTRRRRDTSTGELFSSIPAPMPALPGAMDFRKRVSEMVADVLANAKRDRYDVAAKVSRLCDHETSKAVLDSYTAPSREESNLPLWKVPSLEVACGSRALTEWLVGIHGGTVLWGQEVLDAELGKVQRQLDELKQQEKALRDTLRRIR